MNKKVLLAIKNNNREAITKLITSTPGISGVNYNNKHYEIEYDSSVISPIHIVELLEENGVYIEKEIVQATIGDMSCVMCSKAVTNAIMDIEGVLDINVNYATGKAMLVVTPEAVHDSDIKTKVEDAGYRFLGTEEVQTQKQSPLRLIQIVAGLVAGALLMAMMYGLWAMDTIGIAIILTPVFLFVSYHIFTGAYHALKNRVLSMDVMYAMGIGVSFGASILASLHVLSHEFMIYETSIFLASFLNIGKYLEERAKSRTSHTIAKLLSLSPDTAIVIRDGNEIEINTSDVTIGDTVVVKPQTRIPVDGEIVKGQSFVDESMVTGESVPVFKSEGNAVIGGTLNKNSLIVIKAKAIGQDSILSRIINLVEHAVMSKPRVQRFADRVVSIFIPVILTIATIAALVWYVINGDIFFSFEVFVAVIVIACPCALGLATPTAITVGIGKGAELGILIKNSEALENASKVTHAVFDKTGTLTTGTMTVTNIIAFDNISEHELLSVCASLERYAEHPVGEAIVQYATNHHAVFHEVEDVSVVEGKGVMGTIAQKKVIAGSRDFIQDYIPCEVTIAQKMKEFENEGKTVVVVAQEKPYGIIALSDTPRTDANTVIRSLQQRGIKTAMLTGDNRLSALAIAHEIGMDAVYADVKPEDKMNVVKQLQKDGEIVAFIGDGINDAPVLAQADVGIALGSGTDVAIEAGDVVLLRNRLRDVVTYFELAVKVMRRIKQNIFWAFAYNAVLVPVAAGVLYPFTGWLVKPELAGAAMALSSVTVVSLSLMLKRFKPGI